MANVAVRQHRKDGNGLELRLLERPQGEERLQPILGRVVEERCV